MLYEFKTSTNNCHVSYCQFGLSLIANTFPALLEARVDGFQIFFNRALVKFENSNFKQHNQHIKRLAVIYINIDLYFLDVLSSRIYFQNLKCDWLGR